MPFTQKHIRVLVVDDSILARRMIREGLSQNTTIEVVGEAVDAQDARLKIPMLRPDVITLDVEMPGMNGIDFVKSILPQYPIPIILVSALDLRVFDALAVGAVDFVRKPDANRPDSRNVFLTTLCNKVLIASCSRVRPTAISRPEPVRTQAAAPATEPLNPPKPAVAQSLPYAAHMAAEKTIVALGASTGGTEATLEVLKRLPADAPGMVIVQHMPVGFTKMYAERLERICAMHVKEAQDGDPILQGQVLIAPGDKQMRVVRKGAGYAVSCQFGERVSGHCPSVDALFDSMAQTVKLPMVGIIMTGMGRDGASGLLAMRRAGAHTIGQDRESCVVYGMPMVANEIGAVAVQGACDKIAGMLIAHLSKMK